MVHEHQIFGIHVTPEMKERLTSITAQLVRLLDDQTQTPEEAFIALDAAKRILEAKHGLLLMFPVTDENIGQT